MAVRFRLKTKDDLSLRSDFTLDLTREIGRQIHEAVDQSPEATQFKALADLTVDVTASLTKVDVSVSIQKKGESAIPKEDIERLRASIGDRIHQTVKTKMSEAIQKAMKSARARM